MSTRTRFGGLALGLCASLAGCSVPATQLLAVIDSDFLAADPLRSVHVEVHTPDGGIVTEATFELRAENAAGALGTYRLPLSLGVTPTSRDPMHRVRVVARGLGADGTERVRRSALVGFVPQRTVYLPLFLPRACAGVVCPEGTTCIVESGARCVFDTVNAGDLMSVERSSPGAELTSGRTTLPYDGGTVAPLDAPSDVSSEPPPDAALDVAPDAFDAGPDVADVPATDIVDVMDAAPRPDVIDATADTADVVDVVDVVDVADVVDVVDAAADTASDAGVPASTLGAGFTHSCALARDRSVYCWGGGSFGQVGQGTATAMVMTPTAVPGLTNAAELVVGVQHSCARLVDGTVWCWGQNMSGECGDGSTGGPAPSPVRAMVPNTVAELAIGEEFMCARMNDGAVWCWGSNGNGQLGRGFPAAGSPSVPAASPMLAGSTAITLGSFHGCALLMNRTVRCWGLNTSGQLGNTMAGSVSFSPVAVEGLTDVLEIGAGTYHSCARLSNGTVWCWGEDNKGQVGDGDATGESLMDGGSLIYRTPRQVMGITNAVRLSLGQYHSCAVLADGGVACWGQAFFGQAGDDGTGFYRFAPSRVLGLASPIELATGHAHNCARLGDQSVQCWGDNGYGQIGDNTRMQRNRPTTVVSLP